MRGSAIALVALLAIGCREPRPAPVLVATTTSVENTGLLEALRAAFLVDTGIELDAFVVGSGRALRMARDGQVDVAITHEPRGEAELEASGRAVAQRQFLVNRFLLVGPRENPARIPEGSTVVEAMRRVHQAGARFASRGDESGTHVREIELWRLLGVDPAANPEYRTLGQGMSALLRSASELGAYALTDEATFDALAGSVDLVPIASGGDGVKNVYTVTLVRGADGGVNPSARELYAWLEEERGRQTIAAFIRKHRGSRVP